MERKQTSYVQSVLIPVNFGLQSASGYLAAPLCNNDTHIYTHTHAHAHTHARRKNRKLEYTQASPPKGKYIRICVFTSSMSLVRNLNTGR